MGYSGSSHCCSEEEVVSPLVPPAKSSRHLSSNGCRAQPRKKHIYKFTFYCCVSLQKSCFFALGLNFLPPLKGSKKVFFLGLVTQWLANRGCFFQLLLSIRGQSRQKQTVQKCNLQSVFIITPLHHPTPSFVTHFHCHIFHVQGIKISCFWSTPKIFVCPQVWEHLSAISPLSLNCSLL